MLLDEVLPEFEFSEHHEKEIAAPPQRVKETVLGLRVGDLRLTQPLMFIRLIPRLFTGGARALGANRPVFEFMGDYGFVRLADTDRELLFGIADRFWRVSTDPVELADREAFVRFAEPGYAKAAFNFLFEPAGGGTRLITETRIHALDQSARRKFRLYWMLIRGGSGLIRRDMLGAVRRRAERG